MDDPIENISKKREDDLDMYLRLASDSRTMFKQGLKEARIQEKNWNIDIHSDMTWKLHLTVQLGWLAKQKTKNIHNNLVKMLVSYLVITVEYEQNPFILLQQVFLTAKLVK